MFSSPNAWAITLKAITTSGFAVAFNETVCTSEPFLIKVLQMPQV